MLGARIGPPDIPRKAGAALTWLLLPGAALWLAMSLAEGDIAEGALGAMLVLVASLGAAGIAGVGMQRSADWARLVLLGSIGGIVLAVVIGMFVPMGYVAALLGFGPLLFTSLIAVVVRTAQIEAPTEPSEPV